MNKMKKFDKKVFVLIALSIVALPIMAGLMGDIVKGWLLGQDDWNKAPLPTIVIFICMLIVSCVLIYGIVMLGRKYLSVQIHSLRCVSSHPVLITLLSDQSLNELCSDETGKVWSCGGQVLSEDIEKVCDPKPEVKNFKWQQNLRAARHHKERLKAIYLVGSAGVKGSGSPESRKVALRLFGGYFPGVQVEMPLDGAPDFEDLEGTCKALLQVVEMAKDAGYRESDIVVDITGGQKTASVAAALVTLDRPDVVFQYMGTGESINKAFGFNATSVDHDGG